MEANLSSLSRRKPDPFLHEHLHIKQLQGLARR
jgi:hypothetical protein